MMNAKKLFSQLRFMSVLCVMACAHIRYVQMLSVGN